MALLSVILQVTGQDANISRDANSSFIIMRKQGLISTSLFAVPFPVFGSELSMTELSGKTSKPRERKRTQ